MKDEHDQRTIDYEKQLAAFRATQDPFYVAEQRQRQGMESWLPVSMVATSFGVTSRRIRALLALVRIP